MNQRMPACLVHLVPCISCLFFLRKWGPSPSWDVRFGQYTLKALARRVQVLRAGGLFAFRRWYACALSRTSWICPFRPAAPRHSSSRVRCCVSAGVVAARRDLRPSAGMVAGSAISPLVHKSRGGGSGSGSGYGARHPNSWQRCCMEWYRRDISKPVTADGSIEKELPMLNRLANAIVDNGFLDDIGTRTAPQLSQSVGRLPGWAQLPTSALSMFHH